jgi:hypothetical protein
MTLLLAHLPNTPPRISLVICSISSILTQNDPLERLTSSLGWLRASPERFMSSSFLVSLFCFLFSLLNPFLPSPVPQLPSPVPVSDATRSSCDPRGRISSRGDTVPERFSRVLERLSLIRRETRLGHAHAGTSIYFLPAHLSIRPLITISGPPPTGFLIPYRLHADSEAQPVDPSADLPCRSSTSRSTIISRGSVAKYCEVLRVGEPSPV